MSNSKFISLFSMLLAGFLAFSNAAYATDDSFDCDEGECIVQNDNGGGEQEEEGGGGGNPVVTAVPEPEIYLMMLAGLGLLGFSARRRMNDKN